MRPVINLNEGWLFTKQDGKQLTVDLPHTWNAEDGTDGGNDYFRGVCVYKKYLGNLRKDKDEVFIIEFQGVNNSADVYINDFFLGHHDGGFSTFRFFIDEVLIRDGENVIKVVVDNSKRKDIYPQKADFTLYGGIYRDVNLITANKNHFDILQYGGLGVDINVFLNQKLGVVDVNPFIVGKGDVRLTIFDSENNEVNKVNGNRIEIVNPHLWNGVEDPYLYTLQIDLLNGNEIVDQVKKQIGFRSYKIDPKKGLLLNDNPIKIKGVSLHQDKQDIGNALSKVSILDDVNLIRDVGANFVRLKNYQHDDYLLDLCDKYGFVVFAEIPYLNEHLEKGNENIVNQFKELLLQQKHHCSILLWTLSDSVSYNKVNKKDVDDLHKILLSTCKEFDPYRETTIGSPLKCLPTSQINKISTQVSYQYNFGKIRPLFFINDAILQAFHLIFPSKAIALNDYGEEGIINLHCNFPIIRNNTEEYQLAYHQHLLKFLSKRPWLMANSDMFDYANDSKNSGYPGVVCTGLVSFDHSTKKDSYYLHKAYWSQEPLTFIAGKRFENRNGKFTLIQIISNEPSVSVLLNNNEFKTLKGKKLYTLIVPLNGKLDISAKGEHSEDRFVFKKVDKFDPKYKRLPQIKKKRR